MGEVPELNHKNSCIKGRPGVVVCSCNSSIEEVEMGDPWGSQSAAASVSYLSSSLPMGDSVSQKMDEKKNYIKKGGWYFCLHTHVHTHSPCTNKLFWITTQV